MAHFAQLNENNEVVQVVVVSNDNLLDEDGNENEQVGMGYLKSLYGPSTVWRQTSYNGNFRGHYAKLGDVYLENVSTLGVASTDAFFGPKPFDSWLIDPDESVWVSPLGHHPELTKEQDNQGYQYVWDESSYQQDNITGWVLSQG